MNLYQGSSPRDGEHAALLVTRKLREVTTGAGMGLDTGAEGAVLAEFINT